MHRNLLWKTFGWHHPVLIWLLCAVLPWHCTPNAGGSSHLLQIGIVTANGFHLDSWDTLRGLTWAILQPPNLHREPGVKYEISLFCSDDSNQDSREITAVFSLCSQWLMGVQHTRMKHAEKQSSLVEWAQHREVLIFAGAWPCQDLCSGNKTRCFYVPSRPHLQLVQKQELGTRDDPLQFLRGESMLEIWVRSPSEEELFLERLSAEEEDSSTFLGRLRSKIVLLPFSLPDRVARDSSTPSKSSDLVVALALQGDRSCDSLAVQLACSAIKAANHHTKSASKLAVMAHHSATDEAREMVSASRPCVELNEAGLLAMRTFSDASDMGLEWSAAHVALLPVGCACGWHGAALSALHAGLPLLAPAAPPFNETATDRHDAILLPPSFKLDDAGPDNHGELGGVCWADAERLSGALAELQVDVSGGRGARERSLLRRLSAPQPGLLLARRSAFVLHVHHRLRRRPQQPPPTVVSFWPGPHADHRRTELFRSDALRRHGFSVREVTYGAELGAALREPVEFVVAAKPKAGFLEEVRGRTGAGVYVWTWDLIDFDDDPTRRRWFEAAARLASAAFLNEMGREPAWARLGAHVHFVNDGTVLVGNRGPSRRPTWQPRADSGGDAVFVGTVHAEDTVRVGALRALREAGVALDIYGPAEQWAQVNLTTAGEVWGEAAYEVEARARVVLALSRSPPGIALYRSDRLFRATAAGAAIVANAFPGLPLLLPADALRSVPEEGGPAAVVAAVQAALADDERRMEMRQRAEEVTWRGLTWDDSVRKFLFWLRRLRRTAPAWPLRCETDTACGASAEEGCGSAAVRYYETVAVELMWEAEEIEGRLYLAHALIRCPAHPRLLLLSAVVALRLRLPRDALRFAAAARRLQDGPTKQPDMGRCEAMTELRRFARQNGGAAAGEVLQRCREELGAGHDEGLRDSEQACSPAEEREERRMGGGRLRCQVLMSVVVESNQLSESDPEVDEQSSGVRGDEHSAA